MKDLTDLKETKMHKLNELQLEKEDVKFEEEKLVSETEKLRKEISYWHSKQ